ncbi:hypothetical protein PHAVU_009G117400 [Phaseolus vulgaris]|uniref:CW-type domain-containing protein n=1 Tax=Phaseolus vulgaris TaxID=3885 RepID=V7AYJ6_PHAVU|nr:hypothetical protein PHAVU_009G117400g [Phaseolus vulgaris]ESW09316.1 hypothetical protein PHAVU_009G117400g [Phaseolus vulgaris]
MLIQTSLLSSVEAGLCYVSDYGKDVLCDRMPSGETWQVCLKCNRYPLDWRRKAEPVEENKSHADDPYCSSFGQTSTELETDQVLKQLKYVEVSYTSRHSMEVFVYMLKHSPYHFCFSISPLPYYYIAFAYESLPTYMLIQLRPRVAAKRKKSDCT